MHGCAWVGWRHRLDVYNQQAQERVKRRWERKGGRQDTVLIVVISEPGGAGEGMASCRESSSHGVSSGGPHGWVWEAGCWKSWWVVLEDERRRGRACNGDPLYKQTLLLRSSTSESSIDKVVAAASSSRRRKAKRIGRGRRGKGRARLEVGSSG